MKQQVKTGSENRILWCTDKDLQQLHGMEMNVFSFKSGVQIYNYSKGATDFSDM